MYVFCVFCFPTQPTTTMQFPMQPLDDISKRTQKALRTITTLAILLCAFIGVSAIVNGDTNVPVANVSLDPVLPKYAKQKNLLVTHEIFVNPLIDNLTFRPLFSDSEPENCIVRASVQWSRVAEQLRAINRKSTERVLIDTYRGGELLLAIKFMLLFVDPLKTDRKNMINVLRYGADLGERALRIWETDRTMCNLSRPVAAVVGELTDGFRDVASQLERGNGRYLNGQDMKHIQLLTRYHPSTLLYLADETPVRRAAQQQSTLSETLSTDDEL